MKRMERSRGFTLVELAVVVAVIAVVMAVAVPSLWASRKAANEAGAIGALRAMSAGNIQYLARTGRYAPALVDLRNRGCIDASLGNGLRAGYTYTYGSENSQVWACSADPQDPGTTGDRHFFIDESGVVRVEDGAPATAASSPLE
jgi:type IV pilus assembly protein PilA